MRTNMKIIQDFDKVIIENFEPFQYMIIHYTGSFQGNMVANGNVLIHKNRLFLYAISPDITNILFTYTGNFNIKKTFAYIDNKSNYIVTIKELDNVNTIKSKWNDSTSRYTDLNRTNKRKSYTQTTLRKKA